METLPTRGTLHYKIDNKSLKNLLTQTIQILEKQVFLFKLSGFDFTIFYKQGRENVAANGLSRSFEDKEEEVLFSSSSKGVSGSLLALSMPIYALIEELKKENQASLTIQSICAKYLGPGQHSDHFMIKGGCLFFKDRYYVLEESHLIPKILWEFHDSILGGYVGVLRTCKRVSKYFFSPD